MSRTEMSPGVGGDYRTLLTTAWLLMDRVTCLEYVKAEQTDGRTRTVLQCLSLSAAHTCRTELSLFLAYEH